MKVWILLGFLLLCTAVVTAAEVDWELQGSGFHRTLEMRTVAKSNPELFFRSVTFSFDLPKVFFFDVFEIPSKYEVYPLFERRPSLLPVWKDEHSDLFTSQNDLSNHMFLLSMLSSHVPFDLEAPVFRVPYETNNCSFQFSPLSARDLHDIVGFRVVIPIHLRYEVPHRNGEHLLERHSVTRCLGTEIQLKDEAGATIGIYGNLGLKTKCTEVPVGEMVLLPTLYWSLLALLGLGASSVVLALLL